MEKEKGFRDFLLQESDKQIDLIQTSFEDIFNTEAFTSFVEDVLKKYPKTNGIFVSTSRAFHLVEALIKLKKTHIKVLGFDLIEDNLKHLDANKIRFLINQNPLKQGYLGIINIFNHLVLKKEVKKIQYLPLDVVMRENMQYYLEVEEELHLIIWFLPYFIIHEASYLLRLQQFLMWRRNSEFQIGNRKSEIGISVGLG